MLPLVAEDGCRSCCRQVVELEEARRVLAARLTSLAAAQAEKDARLAHVTAQLRDARRQLAAKQRCTAAVSRAMRVFPHVQCTFSCMCMRTRTVNPMDEQIGIETLC